jgi:hypothetical protein
MIGRRKEFLPDAAGQSFTLSSFDQVLAVEIDAINARRKRFGLPPLEPAQAGPQSMRSNATGLALSGGGIRSAAICLGALQALNYHHRSIATIDYLSTVSGGGFIGASLSAAMSEAGGGQFPFADEAGDARGTIAHLRYYSNYLMPRARTGFANALDTVAVILRDLFAKTALVLAVILACVLITHFAYPDRASSHYA